MSLINALKEEREALECLYLEALAKAEWNVDGRLWNPDGDYPRNSTCLCGSGEKWKKCHLIKKHQSQLGPGDGKCLKH